VLERWQRRSGRLAILGGLILVTASAHSAEPNRRRQPWRKSAGPPPATTSAVSEPPAPPDPGFARRGFFARLALGSGVFSAFSGSASDSRSLVGVPLSLEAYFGATISPYLSLGGGYARDAVGRLSAHDQRIDGDEPDLAQTSFYLEQLAAFLAVYPSSEFPLYGFATLGVGTLNVRSDSDEFEPPLLFWVEHLSTTDPSGILLTLGGGYDTWLNARWALGVSGRVLAGFLTTTELGPERSVTLLMPSVLLSLSYY
jgi:hypothetical protein